MTIRKYECRTYEVAGRGEFPMDMLRYDMACPMRGEDAQRIGRLAHCYTLGENPRVEWENPILIHVFGPGGATEKRWLSFGWSIRERNP